FNLSPATSLIVGVCMSVSASAIALDVLEEMGQLKTRLGTFIVGAGSIDDILEVFLITGILAFLETTVKKIAIAQLLGGVILFALLTLIFRFWFIPLLIKRIEHQPEHAQLFTGALIITLLMAVLADFLGVGALIGALFSGIIIRQILLVEPGHKPWERAEITHTIHTIAFGFLVPFFFFNVGIHTNPTELLDYLPFSIVITALAIAGTVLGSAIGYYIAYHNWKEGLIVGWALNAKGDTELVVATLALSAGAISSAIFSSLIFMAIVSTLISPLVLRRIRF
ncbi:cation:proton antiporter, partial [Candidatus Woesearchaeota archaeon]|nr:cation:proton antiporter [Candidatus Woesearchaeota archaeon]